MKATTITIGGKSYLVTTNNSGELSNNADELAKPEVQKQLKALHPTLDLTTGGYTPALIKLIKELPRAGRSSNSKVRVKTDNDVVTLGSKDFLNADDGTLTLPKGSASNAPKGFYTYLQGLSAFDKMPEEFQSYVNAEASKGVSKQELLEKTASLEAELAALKKKMGLKK